MKQCPVCGQQLTPETPFCPQCGTAMALLYSVRLLTGHKWLDVFLGTMAGVVMLSVLAGIVQGLFSLIGAGFFMTLPVVFLLYILGYALLRRHYPLIGRGVAITGIIMLLLILGLLLLCRNMG